MNPNHNPNSIPNPNSNPPPSVTTDPHYAYYLHNPTPSFPFPHIYADPSAVSAPAAELRPPGVDSYPPTIASFPQQQQGHALSHTQVDASALGYYFDPNLQNWQFGLEPAGYGAAASVMVPQGGTGQLAVAQPGSIAWTNFTFQVQANDVLKKHQKETKVVQSAYCEVCKVECNSKEVLDQHKLGKKHKKNLEKLWAAATPSGTQNPVIGPQPNPDKGSRGSVLRMKKKAAVPLEDLETKKRKIVEGGVAQEAVRVCVICNVVCNSDNVFSNHLAGRKHAAMVKKHGVNMVAAS